MPLKASSNKNLIVPFPLHTTLNTLLVRFTLHNANIKSRSLNVTKATDPKHTGASVLVVSFSRTSSQAPTKLQDNLEHFLVTHVSKKYKSGLHSLINKMMKMVVEVALSSINCKQPSQWCSFAPQISLKPVPT